MSQLPTARHTSEVFTQLAHVASHEAAHAVVAEAVGGIVEFIEVRCEIKDQTARAGVINGHCRFRIGDRMIEEQITACLAGFAMQARLDRSLTLDDFHTSEHTTSDRRDVVAALNRIVPRLSAKKRRRYIARCWRRATALVIENANAIVAIANPLQDALQDALTQAIADGKPVARAVMAEQDIYTIIVRSTPSRNVECQ